MELSETQRAQIFQALGQASVCWTEPSPGVFMSELCIKVGEELIAEIEAWDD